MFNNKSLEKKFIHKNNNNNKKKYNSDDDEKPEGGNRKKRRLNKFKNNNNDKYKHKNSNLPENDEQNIEKGKLRTYIDEKGRKKYDLSGINIADYENKTLALNDEKKLLKFPHADERTFLKGRNEEDIIDVNKIIGQSFSLGKIESNLNQRNKKIIDDKINALGVVQVPQDKDIHQGDVFFCKTCECVLKDNAAYIEHLNGKKRKLFFSKIFP